CAHAMPPAYPVFVFSIRRRNTRSTRDWSSDVCSSDLAGRLQVFRTIALPGALPLVFTGIRLAWGNALILIVVAEILAARSGIGYFIQNSYQTFQVEKMYAGLLVISFIGYVSFLLLDELERWLIPWKAGRTG